MRFFLSTALILSGFAAIANAEDVVIFQTGFESSQGYSPGTLTGHQGWVGSTVGQVENTTVFAGSQALGFSASGTTGQNIVDHGLNYTATGNPNQVVIFDTEFMQSATGTSSLWDVLAAFGSPGFLNQLFVSNGDALFGGGSVTVGRGTWNDYQLVLNFTTQRDSAFVNGQLIGTEAFASPATGLNPVQGLAFGINSSPGTDSAFWDNVSVTSVPEPAFAVPLFGLGATLFALNKRRRRLS